MMLLVVMTILTSGFTTQANADRAAAQADRAAAQAQDQADREAIRAVVERFERKAGADREAFERMCRHSCGGPKAPKGGESADLRRPRGAHQKPDARKARTRRAYAAGEEGLTDTRRLTPSRRAKGPKVFEVSRDRSV